MYKNHYIAVFLGYLDVKDNEMYSRASKFVIYEQKEFNKEKKKLTKLSSAQSMVQQQQLARRRLAQPPRASQLEDHLTKYLGKAVLHQLPR